MGLGQSRKPKASLTGVPFFRVIYGWFLKKTYFNTKKRVEFYRVLKSLTHNGISIQASLKFYSEMLTKYQKRDAAMAYIIDDMLKRMAQGVRFEEAIVYWVPTEEVVLIKSASKDVAKACAIITSFSEGMLSIQSALVSSLTYPVMMIIVLITCLAGFSLFVIPIMLQLSDPAGWPQSAKTLYVFTNFIRIHVFGVSFSLVALVIFSSWSFQKMTFMPLRVLLDVLPPWNIYKPYASTTFLIALAALLRTGSSYHNALRNIRATSSPYLQVYINRMMQRLTLGGNFGDSLVVGLFSGTILINLCVFALTNRLEQGIQYLAEENLEEQRLVFIKKGQVLGYVLMLVVACVIGWVMLSLYGMQSSVKGF